jgi:hypothetical protein
MANIDRKTAMQQEMIDAGSQLVLLPNRSIGIEQSLAPFMPARPVAGLRFDDDHWPCLSWGANSDQGRASNIRMLVEDAFAGNGIQRPRRSNDPVRYPAAKPEPILVIQVARIPHAVPNI